MNFKNKTPNEIALEIIKGIGEAELSSEIAEQAVIEACAYVSVLLSGEDPTAALRITQAILETHTKMAKSARWL